MAAERLAKTSSCPLLIAGSRRVTHFSERYLSAEVRFSPPRTPRPWICVNDRLWFHLLPLRSLSAPLSASFS